MNKKFVKKLCVALVVITSMAVVTGCNKKIKITYDSNAADYIKLGQYKGIEVSADEASLEKSIIDTRVQSDLDSHTEYAEVSREARDKDQVTINFRGSIGGQAIEGFSSDEYSLVLGKDTFIIEGFVDELYGMTAGESKVITLQVPDKFEQEPEYQGKRIVYNVTMQRVENPVAPHITDAYVKENFSYNTVQEYRDGIKAELSENIAEQVYDLKYQAVMVKLQEGTEILGYPEDILNSKKEELDSSVKFYATMYGMTNDEYCQTRYGLSFDEFAKRTVAQQLIFQQIVVDEGFTIDEYYYKGNLAKFAEDQGYTSADTFVEKYGKDKIVRQMLVQKAVDLIMENAVFTNS